MDGRALDHVVVVVDELDTAAATLKAAGFVVTPRSDHPFGTSNRLVMDTRSYVELIAVTDPVAVGDSPFATFVADAASRRRTGPLMVALESHDLESDARRLVSAGLEAPAPLEFGRMATLPDGSTSRVEFAVLFPTLGSATSFSAFFCRHLTPEVVWHPTTLRHPNGVTGLTAIRVSALDDDALDRLAILAETDRSLPMSLGHTRLELGPPGLVFEGSEDVEVHIDGTTLTVTSR